MGLLLLNGGSGLNPRELFANGEQGLWLDPSQMSTLYQDSNGVTPCTAAGDPVGLILDQSRGGLSQIGADLVTNGTFAADSDWTKGANWTIGSGVATKTGGAANNLTQTIGSTAAAWYRVSLDVTRSAGTLTVSLGTSGTTYAITATGSYTFFILAGSGTQTLTLAGDSSFAGTVDNVVVRNIPGNHASQSTSGQRPTLARIPSSGRRNLLVRSEEFDSSSWTKIACSISANNSTAPDGTNTADLIVEDSTTNGRYVQQAITTTVQSYTFSVYLKNPAVNGRRYALLYHNESVKGWAFDLQNGVVGAGGTTAVGAPAAYGIESVGNGWYRCYITITGTAASNQFRVYPISNNGSGNASYTGDGASGILVWGAQLETGSSVTNYQKVVATTDVTESGFADLWYLSFDGSDDSLVTNSVDFTGTAQMTVIAGVRSLANVDQVLVESSANYNNNIGTFILGRANPSLFSSGLNGNGQGINYATVAGAAPRTDVISQSLDNSETTNAGENSLRLNAVNQSLTYVLATPNANAGNFGNYQLFIGRRGGSSLPFNGQLYQLIIRGKTTSGSKLLEAERFVGKKTGVSF